MIEDKIYILYDKDDNSYFIEAFIDGINLSGSGDTLNECVEEINEAKTLPQYKVIAAVSSLEDIEIQYPELFI